MTHRCGRLAAVAVVALLTVCAPSDVRSYVAADAAPTLTDLPRSRRIEDALQSRRRKGPTRAVGLTHLIGVCGWHSVGADGALAEVSEGQPSCVYAVWFNNGSNARWNDAPTDLIHWGRTIVATRETLKADFEKLFGSKKSLECTAVEGQVMGELPTQCVGLTDEAFGRQPSV